MDTYVFDISRGSTNDGPGIRTTVFLKGCPLRCQWCHNPESQSFKPQLCYNEKLCIHCGECDNFTNAEKCPSGALSVFGKEYDAAEILEILLRDKDFYTQSGGGVTISGGEPLSHRDFCLELLNLCRENNIHTCIETSGMGDKKVLAEFAEMTDLFLFDCKVSDNESGLKYIGAKIDVINENLEFLLDGGYNVILRCPVIPTVNDNEKHFNSIIGIMKKYPSLKAEILPYHNFGIGKAKNIGISQKVFPVPNENDKEKWILYFRKNNMYNIK